MGYGIDILNNIHANSSSEYSETIPLATQNNFAEIGTYLENYDGLANEFHNALWNKIGKTLIETAIAENRLERFKRGKAKPLDIESIFVDMAKGAYTYDPEGKDVLARIKDDNVKAIYHRLNRQDCYDMTIGDLDFSRVFRSEATFESFIASKFTALYTRATDDEWVFMKNCLATYNGYFNVQVEPITEANAPETTKKFLKAIRKMVMRLSFAKREFNKMKAKTATKAEKLVLLINADILAEIDVEVLAKAMNMGKTDIQIEIIPMDDFGTLENTYALMVDEDFYKEWDTLSKMEGQRNSKGLFTNWFYHIHQIHAISTFKNAVRFTTETVFGEEKTFWWGYATKYTYTYREGMTWADWVSSEYNVDGYKIEDDKIVSADSTSYVGINGEEIPVKPTDVIQYSTECIYDRYVNN